MKKLLAIALILVVSIPVFSYAINMPNVENNAFLSCTQTETVQGEKVVLSLNLDLIKYDNFEFILKSNTGLENVSLEEKNINVETNSNGLKLTANKADLNVKQVDLYYQIPENAKVGTKINLTGTLKENVIETTENKNIAVEEKTETTNKEEIKQEEVSDKSDIKSQEESMKAESIDKETEESKKEETSEKENIQKPVENKEENVVEEVTITITVVDKKVEDNKQESIEKDNFTREPNENNKTNTEAIKTEQSVVAEMQTVQTKAVSINMQGSTATTNTYNGESNNYLETLEVEGQTFYPTYTKTNTTYFLEVENSITELDMTAEAEDSSAKVRIYGDTSLEVGENKVLISVTAENGEVKTYRIYVKRK